MLKLILLNTFKTLLKQSLQRRFQGLIKLMVYFIWFFKRTILGKCQKMLFGFDRVDCFLYCFLRRNSVQ